MPVTLPAEAANALAAFILVFFRMTGITLAAPLFANRSFPVQLRVAVAFLLAVACFPVALAKTGDGFFVDIFAEPIGVALAAASELAIGWCLGFIAASMVWAAQLAGHILDQEIGLSIGEVYDPVSESQSSVSTQLFFTLAILAFVLLDGHRLLVLALTGSFEVAPPGTFPFGVASGELLVSEVGGGIWSAGLRMALPTMIALMLVTVAMAVLARIVPEMNIFILGFGVRIVFGLFVTMLVLPFVADAFRGLVVTTSAVYGRFLSLAGG